MRKILIAISILSTVFALGLFSVNFVSARICTGTYSCFAMGIDGSGNLSCTRRGELGSTSACRINGNNCEPLGGAAACGAGGGPYPCLVSNCSWQCEYNNQGCAAYGCPAGTSRQCENCTGTWSCQCVTDPACSCGNGACDNGETCSSCTTDCGTCCDANLWGACSVSCGTGTQYNDCGTPRSCTVSACSAWWQVKDGDVATNGDIVSPLPATGAVFDTSGDGGYPGVPASGGSTSLTTTNVSDTGWMATSRYNHTKVYNSNYFANAVPADVVVNSLTSSIDGTDISSGGTDTNGIYWYEYDSALNGGVDLTINTAADIGSRKVILIVKDADVNLKSNINLTKGSGFFLLATTGNIIVDPGVGGGASPDLEGIYVADETFQTGAAANQLWIRGSVAAYGGITLERDLGSDNATTPGEIFEFAPDQAILFPAKLAARSVTWQEVAP